MGEALGTSAGAPLCALCVHTVPSPYYEGGYPLRPSGVAASRHTAPRHPPIRLRTTFIGKCRDTTLQESAPKVQNVANTSRFSHANLCKRLPIIVRDMWDRLTAPTPTVTLESTFRQPTRRFTVSRPPPSRLSFHLCFRVVLVVCVFVPCGILRGSCPSEWSRERSAPSSVARVCQLTPLCSRTTLCRLSLLHHRRRWVSLTYHVITQKHPQLKCE